MIEGWEEGPLEELVDVFLDYRGKTPPKTDEGVPLITAKIVKGGRIQTPTEFISEETYATWMSRGYPQVNDVVLTVEAPLGEVALLKDSYTVPGQRIIMMRPKEAVLESGYLKYFFQSATGQHALNSRASGTTVMGIKAAILRKTPIPYPELPEQKAIAEILSSLDDKIDLLHRQNATLEALAETLFRQYFIEEAQDDWDYVELGEFIECQNGVSYKSTDLNPSKIAMLTLKNFHRDGSFRFDGFKEFTGRHKDVHLVSQGDLVVAHTDITQDAAIIGNPVRVIEVPAYEKLIVSMDLVKVTAKFDWFPASFLYRLMRTRYFKHHCVGYSNGSTVLHLSKAALSEFEFFMPPHDKIAKSVQFFDATTERQIANHQQIQTLQKLRDTLLPKLMSGAVRVQYERLDAETKAA